MEVVLRTGSGFMSQSKFNSILVSYLVVASYMVIYGRAGSFKNVEVPALLAFGDSIVDPGNNNYFKSLAKANFPPYGRDIEGGVPTGRFCNGKVPSDLLAELFGIKELVPPYLDPSLQISDLVTGVSFASGGSGFDPMSLALVGALSLDDQLKYFREYIDKLKAAVGESRTSTIVSESVYIVCQGTNDIVNSYFLLPVRRQEYNISSYAALMVDWASTFIQELYAIGGRRIALTNLPPTGCLPFQRTLRGGLSRECDNTENEADVIYNEQLRNGLRSLNRKLPGIKLAYFDIYTPLLDIMRNPSPYGFEVSNEGCCGTGQLELSILCNKLTGTCSDPSKYVFWDAAHPSAATYKILFDLVSKTSINELF